MKTFASTGTYATTRISVIDDHFEMFLTCSGMSDDEIRKILTAVENRELSAVGIYLEDDGYKIAEVEFTIDWDKHQEMLVEFGMQFDGDLPGWKNNVAPEAYIAVQRLVSAAKNAGKRVHSWIRVTPSVYGNPSKHQEVCKNLGYAYGKSVSPWKNKPNEHSRPINYLPEAAVIQRIATSSKAL